MDLSQIEEQIKELKIDLKLLPSREIKELPKILNADESLKDIVGGFYSKGSGVLVATDKRLIFIDKGMFFGLRVENFPYDSINSIKYSTGMITGEIFIYSAGNSAKIEAVAVNRCKSFAENVQRLISRFKAATNISTDNSNDLLNQLERLNKLKNDGVLTEEEFSTAKKKLL